MTLITKIKVAKLLLRRKYAYHTSEIRLNYMPLMVLIELTNNCNLSCKICCNKNLKRARGYMSMELYKKIINDIAGRVHAVSLTLAGEPLLHKDLISMISYAKMNHLKVELYTNATLLTQELANNLIAAELDKIIISFDGEDKKLYKKIRVGASYKEVLSNIIALLRTKNSFGSKLPKVVIQVVKLTTHHSSLSLDPEFTKLFSGHDIYKYDVFFAHNWGGKVPEQTPIHHRPYHPCEDVWYRFAITWDGLAVPCCLDLDADYILGDVNIDNALSIWNNTRMQELREKLVFCEHKDIKLCASCSKLYT